MRVTNEQAEKIKALCKSINNTNCYGCRYTDEKYEFCPSTRNAPQLAADLLEARELIKEMREMIAFHVVQYPGCECRYCTKERELMERTKEYAE